jgi:hypothetical protein
MLLRCAFVAAAAHALAAPTRLKKWGRTTKSQRAKDEPDAETPGRVTEAPGLDLGPVHTASITGQNTATLELEDRTVDIDTRDLSQRVDEAAWLKCRAALDLTASEFDAARDKHKFSSREDVLRWQAGAPRPKLGGPPIEFGKRHESTAIKAYARKTGHDVAATGLWTDSTGKYGASPDGLVVCHETGEAGLLEVKCLWSRRHKRQLAPLTKCPNRYFAQVQGQMEVCDREWCDLVLWVPHDVRVLRVPRDRAFWSDELGPAVAAFSEELEAMRVSSP